MPTVIVTADTFETTVIGREMAIVAFMTEESDAFAALAPDFEAFADANPDILFGTIDARAEGRLAAAARITAIPTIMAFREGNLVFRQPGALENHTIQQLIDAVRGLDMQQVRAALVHRIKQHEQRPTVTEVSVSQLHEALDRHALVIDVRTPLEYSAGHVPGSVLMPLHTLGKSAENLPTDARVYVICKIGDRSRQACELLAGLGFEAVNVTGGMVAWNDAGYASEVSA